MEHSVGTVIDTVDTEEKDEEERRDEKLSDTEPVVYQLVRVEGDGRLVPATDDEVKEVEKLLEDEKSELAIKHAGGCLSSEGFTKKSVLEGLMQAEDTEGSRKLNARLEEERLWLSGKSFSHSPKCVAAKDQTSESISNGNACLDKLQPENTSSERGPGTLEPNTVCNVEVGTAEACSGAQNEAVASRSSISKSCTSSLPDFSILRGEICLDDFSIRELQEAFRATFGRETSVKDKLWLKRRIAMGLTNSCHVPNTNFIIKDNKIILSEAKEDPMKQHQSEIEAESSLSLDIRVINITHQNIEASLDSQIADDNVSGKRLRSPPLLDDMKDENSQMEHCTAKRMRKPTKRYIEELSELESRECTAKSYSCMKNSGDDNFPANVPTRTVFYGDANRRLISTRYVSLGGFSFHVPFVLRARRGRPRKNTVVLMKYHPSFVYHMEETSVLIPARLEDNENGSPSKEIRSVSVQILQPNFVGEMGTEMDKDALNSEDEVNLEHRRLDEHEDSTHGSANNSQQAPKSGQRRKHHRAWTLCEVRKLVDGVAKYGAGRWSEIRRLAFASYSYRTSVDLKDKWRNLLRASLAQCPTEKGAKNSRKHTSIPIPTPILSQVRELAKLHAQTGINTSPRKPADQGSKDVHGEGSGFL
ncbi:hypothetical protein Cni_G02681 [Canna indica]|uniref:Uncharacterized protein n=1 Tax=Canna indica TaxID=4628 RepID=A0AAQ3JT67_9LILI|nr:hypothetical protein Cni_G02681 [Canna indica]